MHVLNHIYKTYYIFIFISKWCVCVCVCLVVQSCPAHCEPMDYSPPGSSVHGIFQAKLLEQVAIPVSQDLPNPGFEPRSPTAQVDSLPSETPRKPRNILVGSLVFLQGIFPTLESNWGLLHCWQILYQRATRESQSFSVLILFFWKRCSAYFF